MVLCLGVVCWSKELSLYQYITLFLNLSLRFLLNPTANILIITLQLPRFQQFLSFVQFFPPLLPNLGSILYSLLLHFFLYFFLVELFTAFLGADHVLQVVVALCLVECYGCCDFFFLVGAWVLAVVILAHLYVYNQN